jgi:hypothetical protein
MLTVRAVHETHKKAAPYPYLKMLKSILKQDLQSAYAVISVSA